MVSYRQGWPSFCSQRMTFILLPPLPKWCTTMPVLCGAGDGTQASCIYVSTLATELVSAWCHLVLLHIRVYRFSAPGKWQGTSYILSLLTKITQGKHLLLSRANHIHSRIRLILATRSFWSSSIDTCNTAWKLICLRVLTILRTLFTLHHSSRCLDSCCDFFPRISLRCRFQ